MTPIRSSRRQDSRGSLLWSAARAAGLAPSPAAFESGRESERGRLNKSKEHQTGSESIDCYTRRSFTTIYYKRGVLGAAGRGQPIEDGVNTRKGGAARCYKLRNMGTLHAIRPTRQTPNALLDTATYCRSHNELGAKRAAMNIWTSHAISQTLPLGCLSHTERQRQKQ